MDGSPVPPLPASPAARGKVGLAIAALVLGILALATSFLLIGAVCGIVGIVLGILQLKGRDHGRTMAWCGITLSILGIVAAGLFGGLYFYGFKKYQALMEQFDGGEESGPDRWEGVMSPDINFKTLDGQAMALSDLKGKRVVLDFWATWCPPCVKEIPHFIKLRGEISTNDLVIIGISDEEKPLLESFIKKHKINYPIGEAVEAPDPFGSITSIPTTFFIDRKGVIQKVLVGYHDYDEIHKHATAADYEGEPKPAPSAPAEKEESESTAAQATN